MFQVRRHRQAFVALTCALATSQVFAAAPAGHDPGHIQMLAGLPVHVVLLNDSLRSQIAYSSHSVANDAVSQQIINNTVMNTPGLSMGQGIAAGALGGAIAGALINAQLLAAAKDQVEPADAEMRQQSCMLDYHQELGAALQRAIVSSNWGQGVNVQQHLLAPKQRLAELVSPDNERYVLTASYSMSPDYSAVITTVNASAYSPKFENAPAKWQRDPAWADELVVVSNRVFVPPKTQADIDAAVAAEDARYAGLGVTDLIVQANAGDKKARSKAVKLMAEHKKELKSAHEAYWTPTFEARERARVWSADGCAKLRATLASNTVEVEAMLGQLFRGELPARVNEVPKSPRPPPIGESRQVQAEAVGVFRMTRDGDAVPLAYRYSWLPEPDAK